MDMDTRYMRTIIQRIQQDMKTLKEAVNGDAETISERASDICELCIGIMSECQMVGMLVNYINSLEDDDDSLDLPEMGKILM